MKVTISLVLLVAILLVSGCDLAPQAPQKPEASVSITAAVQKANLDIQPQIVTEGEPFNGIRYRMDRVPLPDGGYMYRLLSNTGGSAVSYVPPAAKPAACPTPTPSIPLKP